MADFKKLEPDLAFVKGVMDAGGDTVNRCYQCATCSIVCPLSTPESPFPRKEMLWAQWGMASKVSGDADVWLCHQCGDCSAYCPRDAKPGDVLGAIRANAIRYYAEPKALADMMSTSRGMIGVGIASIVAVLIMGFIWSLITGHSFPFPVTEDGKVEYHLFLSVIPIDILFLPLAGFVAFVSYKGVVNFWQDISKGAGLGESYTGTMPAPSLSALLKKYLVPAVKEILAHERFKKCGQTAERAKGHKWVLWGFVFLFITTSLGVIFADVLGNIFHAGFLHSPYAFWHPVKIFGTIGAVLLMGGIWMVRTMREEKTKEGILQSSEQDWNFIWLIFAVGASGILSWAIRLTNIPYIAYPIYWIHLGTVATLFLALPFTKFGHMLYRTTAYVFQAWAADVRAGQAGFGLEKPVVSPSETAEAGQEEEAVETGTKTE